MPERATRSVVWAARACLAFIVPLAAGRAVAYNPWATSSVTAEPPPVSVQLIVAYVPLEVWAVGWLAATLVLVVGVVRPRSWTTVPVIVMCGVWASAYAVGWLSGRDPDGYLTASIYACIAGLIFSGNFLAGRALALSLLLAEKGRRP